MIGSRFLLLVCLLLAISLHALPDEEKSLSVSSVSSFRNAAPVTENQLNPFSTWTRVIKEKIKAFLEWILSFFDEEIPINISTTQSLKENATEPAVVYENPVKNENPINIFPIKWLGNIFPIKWIGSAAVKDQEMKIPCPQLMDRSIKVEDSLDDESLERLKKRIEEMNQDNKVNDDESHERLKKRIAEMNRDPWQPIQMATKPSSIWTAFSTTKPAPHFSAPVSKPKEKKIRAVDVASVVLPPIFRPILTPFKKN